MMYISSITAASGTPAGINPTNANSTGYNFTCSQGLLTYGVTSAVFPNVTLAQVVDYFSNWTAAAPGRIIDSSGTGLGADRTYSIPSLNVSFSETLRLNQTNATTGSLHQQWGLSAAGQLTFDNLTLFSTFNDLTAYTNVSTSATELQYFILGCVSEQALGLSAVASLVQQAVSYYAAQLSGTGNASAATVPASSGSVKLV